MKFEIVKAEDILEFRQAMLWPNMPISHVMVAQDDAAIHLCARSNGKIYAAGSFFLTDERAQLRKLAVDPQCRGKGIGRRLVSFGSDVVRKEGARELWCDARVDSIGFYEKLGFQVGGQVYLKSEERYRKATLAL